MPKVLRGSKRAILKKVTAVNLFADQATQIQAIMEAAGAHEVAPIVRQLLDEALGARRRKSVQREDSQAVDQPHPSQDLSDSLQIIETLLLRIIGQGETTFRIQSVSLELLQETLAKADAGKVSLWEFLLKQSLKDKGRSEREIGRLENAQDDHSKRYAYELAHELKKELDLARSNSNANDQEEEDRQSSFVYDASDIEDPALSSQT
jgi:hypothetical protein